MRGPPHRPPRPREPGAQREARSSRLLPAGPLCPHRLPGILSPPASSLSPRGQSRLHSSATQGPGLRPQASPVVSRWTGRPGWQPGQLPTAGLSGPPACWRSSWGSLSGQEMGLTRRTATAVPIKPLLRGGHVAPGSRHHSQRWLSTGSLGTRLCPWGLPRGAGAGRGTALGLVSQAQQLQAAHSHSGPEWKEVKVRGGHRGGHQDWEKLRTPGGGTVPPRRRAVSPPLAAGERAPLPEPTALCQALGGRASWRRRRLEV